MTADRIDWSFEAPRVRGRLVGEDDADLYLGLYADASVMRHIAAPMSADAAMAVFANALKHNANPAARARYWHVSHRRTGQTLGLAALVRDAAVPTRGELGLMLLPQAQRTGVGVQSLEQVIDGALSQRWRLGIDEVVGRHTADNPGAGRLMSHLGFDPFRIAPADAGTAGSVAWRMTAVAWHERLASRGSTPHHR